MANKFNIGDLVYIVERSEKDCPWESGGLMDKFLNDGQAYRIISATDRECLVDCGWGWYFEYACLSLTPNKGVVKEPKKKAIKKKKLKKANLPSLKKVLQESVEEEQGHSISSYAIDSDRGRRMYENAVCYASITVGAKKVNALAVSLGNHARLLSLSPEKIAIYKRYTQYVLSSVAFGPSFLTRRACNAFKYGIDMNVQDSLSHIVASLTALREGVEFPDKLDVFDEVLKKGYSGDVAYFISSCFDKSQVGFKLNIRTTGHRLIAQEHSLKGIVNTFKNGFNKEAIAAAPYSTYSGSFRCQQAFCPTNGNLIRDVKKYIEITVKGDGWGKIESVSSEDVYKLADIITKLIGEKE